jgi:hypothetical protein
MYIQTQTGRAYKNDFNIEPSFTTGSEILVYAFGSHVRLLPFSMANVIQCLGECPVILAVISSCFTVVSRIVDAHDHIGMYEDAELEHYELLMSA